ncbi:unnamed protein product [Adineta ricciae]|uniref:Uncharacterized protein n=1 Tax=Adineta ricciae TaxID=249248 RepID=A0A813ZEU0_ADIRI|nr:unnamed protein product [Adineta ricciae]
MGSSSRLGFLGLILLFAVVEINAGFWMCDWVNNRGWVYCERGYCNSFGRKRNLEIAQQKMDPIQNDDGVFCANKQFCFACRPIDDGSCYLTLLHNYSPSSDSELYKKRSEEACG